MSITDGSLNGAIWLDDADESMDGVSESVDARERSEDSELSDRKVE